MPLPWDNIDTRNAILCAAVPTSAALIETLAACKDQSIVRFLKNQRFPQRLAPSCQYLYLALNVGTAVPFGYASYLIWKIGGGFDYTDTTVALCLYGATSLAGALAYPTLKYQNIKSLAVHAGVTAVLALVTSIAFYKIDKISGYWTAPFTLWTMYCAAITTKNIAKQLDEQAKLLDEQAKLLDEQAKLLEELTTQGEGATTREMPMSSLAKKRQRLNDSGCHFSTSPDLVQPDQSDNIHSDFDDSSSSFEFEGYTTAQATDIIVKQLKLDETQKAILFTVIEKTQDEPLLVVRVNLAWNHNGRVGTDAILDEIAEYGRQNARRRDENGRHFVFHFEKSQNIEECRMQLLQNHQHAFAMSQQSIDDAVNFGGANANQLQQLREPMAFTSVVHKIGERQNTNDVQIYRFFYT